MPRLRVPRPFAAITFAAVVACTASPTNVCACLTESPHTVIYGRVTDAAGAPVTNAAVRVEIGPFSCQGLEVRGDAQTNSAGEYFTMLYQLGAQNNLCVRLVARDFAPSGPRYSAPQQFTVSVPDAFPADSLRVDHVIPTS
jgi:hypothetical protein